MWLGVKARKTGYTRHGRSSHEFRAYRQVGQESTLHPAVLGWRRFVPYRPVAFPRIAAISCCQRDKRRSGRADESARPLEMDLSYA
jgi:hypothetical protein